MQYTASDPAACTHSQSPSVDRGPAKIASSSPYPGVRTNIHTEGDKSAERII